MSVVAVTVLIGVLLAGAGFAGERLVERHGKADLQGGAFALLTGWALLCLVGVVCAVSGARLTLPALAVGVVGITGYLVTTAAWSGLRYLALAWLLLLPLLAIASVIPPTMADEFPYLLPNAKILVETDLFPDQSHPNVWTSKPEYPPALSLIGYAAARLGRIDGAYPGKAFTVLLAGAFGLALAQLIAGRVGWLAAIAIGVALASVLNPFFDPRLALSAHTDTPTGFVLALTVAASWRALHEPLPRWPLHAAAAAIVLVLLRETNVVFVAALAVGLLICRRPKLAMIISAPALVVFGLWRLYITIAGWTPSMAARPLSEWDWSAPFIMVRALFGERLANNPVLGIAGAALAFATVLLCLRIIRSDDRRIRALFALAGTVSIAWCAFLAWAYAAVFTNEVETANSAWRYLSQLGPLLIFTFVAALVPSLPAGVTIARSGTALAAGAGLCLVALLAPLATARHWRIDCRHPDVVVVRHAALEIGKRPIANEKIAVVHPDEPSWYSEALDYELNRPVRSSRGYRRAEQVPAEGYRLDLTKLDRKRLTQDGKIPPLELSHWNGSNWQRVLTLAAEQPRACGANPFAKWDFAQTSR
jgi:hypothetical protein